MLRRPRPLLAASVLLLGVLLLLGLRPPPEVHPADAERWEGQRIRLVGLARDVALSETGTRFVVEAAGWGVPVLAGKDVQVAEGAPVEVVGRMARHNGALRLYAEPDGTTAPARGVLRADVDQLARDPQAFEGKAVVVRGDVQDGQLVAERHAIALGTGPWPRNGPVEATVVLRYSAPCACNTLDAREVAPWIP